MLSWKQCALLVITTMALWHRALGLIIILLLWDLSTLCVVHHLWSINNAVIISAWSRAFVTTVLELFLTKVTYNETFDCPHRKLYLGWDEILGSISVNDISIYVLCTSLLFIFRFFTLFHYYTLKHKIWIIFWCPLLFSFNY